jgi:hypothetical protein
MFLWFIYLIGAVSASIPIYFLYSLWWFAFKGRMRQSERCNIATWCGFGFDSCAGVLYCASGLLGREHALFIASICLCLAAIFIAKFIALRRVAAAIIAMGFIVAFYWASAIHSGIYLI